MKGLSLGQKLCSAFLCAALCVLLVGCGGSKVSKANYDKVTNDMTETQVKDLLGTPTETKDVPGGAGKILIWKSGNDTISVTFVKDKVAGKISSFDLAGK